MEIFIDSADLEEIKEAWELGIVDGVTTNPTLIAKSSTNIEKTIEEIVKIVSGPISVEVADIEFSGMIKEGEKILSIAPNVVLKLPITWSGIRACKYFNDMGRDVNMTLCFSVAQAILAAKAGATFVSPFIGRVDDMGHDGCSLIADIRTAFDNYPTYKARLLASSIRNVSHFLQSTLLGADSFTMPLNIIKQLIAHPLTDNGIEKFVQDWRKSGLEI
ncbi:MAG: hypothetical protein RLZZ59_751 [Pseudomonadota bacterium]|jgi:transaldolase